MAWYCSALSNSALIDNLCQSGIIQSYAVSSAMKMVDRKNYVQCNPYLDSPQDIGCKQTISAPHMHAYAMESLLPALLKPDAKVLDVGCGSGYLLAVMARLNPQATVYGIDCVPDLVTLAVSNIAKEDKDLLENGRVIVQYGDGWDDFSVSGIPLTASFDAIHVGAAAPTIPFALLKQLKLHGRMVIPIGPESGQELIQVERNKESTSQNTTINQVGEIEFDMSNFTIRELMSVRYVPLVKGTKSINE